VADLGRSARKIRVHIRQANPEDCVGIAAVVHAVNELRSVATQSRDVTANTIEMNLKRMTRSGNSTAYVAEEPEGVIIGYGAVHWIPFLFLSGGEAYVTELFVRPADCGKSAGSNLLETIVVEAKRRGCSRVSLLNGRDGESYRRNFYKNRGWVERDRMANFILPIPKGTNQAPEPTDPCGRGSS
jgi:N-acetylglutamate synthase-like GNAT family acetyltransferase